MVLALPTRDMPYLVILCQALPQSESLGHECVLAKFLGGALLKAIIHSQG